MTYYTLGTAAHACGLNKSTVLRAIKAGKISATRDEHGQWQIDPAELHRVYPPVASTDAAQPGEQRYAPAPSRDRTDELVAQLREQLADMRNERDRARADADTWRAAFERECAQRALPAPSNNAQSAQATPATAWQRFLRWRRATGCFAGAGLLLILATVAATAQAHEAGAVGRSQSTSVTVPTDGGLLKARFSAPPLALAHVFDDLFLPLNQPLRSGDVAISLD